MIELLNLTPKNDAALVMDCRDLNSVTANTAPDSEPIPNLPLTQLEEVQKVATEAEFPTTDFMLSPFREVDMISVTLIAPVWCVFDLTKVLNPKGDPEKLTALLKLRVYSAEALIDNATSTPVIVLARTEEEEPQVVQTAADLIRHIGVDPSKIPSHRTKIVLLVDPVIAELVRTRREIA